MGPRASGSNNENIWPKNEKNFNYFIFSATNEIIRKRNFPFRVNNIREIVFLNFLVSGILLHFPTRGGGVSIFFCISITDLKKQFFFWKKTSPISVFPV